MGRIRYHRTPARVQIRRKHGDIWPQSVHPGPTAGGKFRGVDLIHWAGSEGLESDWVKCIQCGWPNDQSVVSEGSGYGNIASVVEVGLNIDNPTVGAGCRFCGSSNYKGYSDDGFIRVGQKEFR